MPDYKLREISVGAIKIRARVYRGGAKTPVICLHGLTRNAADFDELAPLIAATGKDVIALSLRGRGESDRDPVFANYFPTVYRDDVIELMDQFGLESAVFVGTSLGGITTMLVNEKAPERVRAAILNDVGPDLAPEGLTRIASYAGKMPMRESSFDAAIASIRSINQIAFPNADEAFWAHLAKRTYREIEGGIFELDYDPNIGKALAEAGPAPDLWPAFSSLAAKPTLLIHGAISDLLTPPIIEKMHKAHTNLEVVDVPNVGHAPFMTEPAAWSVIESFLTKLD